MYTFETHWPAPFPSGWQRSKKTFTDLDLAAVAAATWLATCFENDVQVSVRLAKVEDK